MADYADRQRDPGRERGPARRARAAAHRAARPEPAGRPAASSTSWPSCFVADGDRAGTSRAAAPARLDVGALVRDPEPRVIVTCGSGGVGKTTTAAAMALLGAEAGPAHGRAHHRPGPPAGPVDGAHRARQHPARGRRRRRAAAVRDDARHEAHVRRRGARALHARTRRADLRQPLLPVAVVLLRRDAGVHGDGEARPAGRARTSGTSSSSTPRRRARRWTSWTRRTGSAGSSTAG